MSLAHMPPKTYVTQMYATKGRCYMLVIVCDLSLC
jgi:hypothetical protein